MFLFTQRTQVERDGAKRLLRGLAKQFDVQACFVALSDRISIEQVGHDLAVGLQAMLAAQSQATEQARQDASYWKQRCEMNSSEAGRLTKVQFDLSEQLRQTKSQVSAEQKLTAQEYRRNYELTYKLEREQAQRIAERTDLETQIADLNRIVAKQQLEILKLRGEETDDEDDPQPED